ncbi:MAG: CHAT domain-containing protein [Pseudomonadota bacterium]
MSRLRITAADERRSAEALAAHDRYQREMLATLAGRESNELRERAHPLVARGHRESAHALYQEAFALFGPGDQGAAAAAAAYDLGESFAQLRGGSRMENLREAERLLRLSLASPFRQRDPFRIALTRDALGRVQRHLAKRFAGPEAHRLLGEGIREIARACEIMEAIGPAGWLRAGEFYTNLGNALLQDDLSDEAVQAHEFSLRYLRAVEEYRDHWAIAPGVAVRNVWRLGLPLLNLAGALGRRNEPGDADRALRLCEEAAAVGTPQEIAQARVSMANLERARGHVDRARRAAKSVELAFLAEAFWPDLSRLFLSLGLPAEAVAVARAGRKQAVEERRNALADHLADHAAARAQRFGVLAARGWIDQGDPIAAFLEIENVSGLRYYDRMSAQARTPPADRVAREVASVLHQHGIVAKDLDETASRISYLREEDQRTFLAERRQDLEHAIAQPAANGFPARGVAVVRLAVESLARAAGAPSPVTALREAAAWHLRRRQDLETALQARGTPAAQKAPWDAEMSPAALREVLAEEPGRVALRVHLADELTLAVVWVEDGALVGRSSRRPLPEGMVQRLTAGVTALTGSDAPASSEPELDWGEVLAFLDPADLLPPDVRHLVILPSLLAALVPWAAVGVGVPLVQRVGAISVMPCLMPMWACQARSPARGGVLSVSPGDLPGATATRFHGAAFSVALQGETRLLGAEATGQTLDERARDADVVVFYTHGQGGRIPEPGLLLADTVYAPDATDRVWWGVERVELWACQTGINLPDEPLIPFVDDAFGLDIDFHAAGARSTIGTLWSVPDFITGCLVARFRRALNDGSPAPVALAEAQRWWLSQGVPTLVALLRERPEAEAVQAFLGTLGVEAPVDAALGGVLGPLPADGRLPPAAVEEAERRLTRPEAWAGYRFVGAAERRPREVGLPDRLPLSAVEDREVQRILDAPPPESKDIDAWLDDELDALHATMAGREPTPDEALRAARLYADRRYASPRHNHLRGLAWLHEALAAPVLEAEDRVKLRVEAAWMWVEIARRDTPEERFLDVYPSDTVAAARAAALATDLGEGPDVIVLAAWIDLLGGRRGKVEARARRHWERARASANLDTGDAYADLRRNRAVLELALCLDPVPPEARVIAVADPVGDDSIEVQTALHRWDVARTAVLQRLGIPWHGSFDFDYLPQRDLPRAVGLRSYGRNAADPDWDEVVEAQNKGPSLLEYYYWGTPSGDRGALWESTGSPSRAWTFAGGAFLLSRVLLGPSAGRVPHFFSCLQLGADLRVAPLCGWARTMGSVDVDTVGRFGHDVWAVDHLLGFLSDAAALPGVSREGGQSAAPPWDLDPFQRTPADLRAAATEAPIGLTGWLVATSIEDWFDVPLVGRTAAFQVERLVSRLLQHIQGQWRSLGQATGAMIREKGDLAPLAHARDRMFDFLDPDAEIRTLEFRLRELPEGLVVLGLMVAWGGQLLAMSLWREGGELRERVHVSEPGDGARLAVRLAEILRPLPEDVFPERGRAGPRAAAWTQLTMSLDPILQEVLGPCASPQRHLQVFAPGALRSLPALGLTLGGEPLHACFASISHLPSLGFERRATGDPTTHTFTVCTLAPEREDGETRFGEAAIGSLRRWFPPEVRAEVLQPEGPDIVEVEAMEAVRERAQVVRFYGVGHPSARNPATVGLRLPGGRTLGLPHTRRTCLPNARAVELWASVGSGAEMLTTLAFDGDHLPALSRSFLMNGAAGVLDLAWPAHDLVKALVAECFGAIRRTGPLWEPFALAQAVHWVRQTLAVWRSHAPRFATKADALHVLDLVRRKAAAEAGLDPHAVIPFAPLSDAPSLGETVEEMIAEVCHPVHLAAFRWWGA